ncbi:hypothetical protein ACHHZC_11360 [Citrobacter freundii complex sp. 2024EL-00228]|jgi:hypothetical protein|uniref:Uncharacterized protein n=2 Tax=Citrobacter freundii TaxID=546 RepID=A0A9P3Z249_CITFR|nr:hypothetical protein [Citrobacter freundii]EJC8215990.1 hypothetical protein [Citrobacter freundii]ELK7553058.1 hypothetical protein [Citrobacter freundii]MBJ9313021.1 hypothetical protein [Citrobacter freundii]MDH1411620.1 hypothetical protein [Citrobacter freundii]STB10427.1 Uncharacterised protein [Citrobacter freundii]
MYAWRCFVSWLKGECPLVFTYWITGIFPSLLLSGCLYTITYQLEYGSMAADTGHALLIVHTVIALIYTPLALWAITASAIKYHGLLLWKILALLAVVGNCFDYLALVFTLIF